MILVFTLDNFRSVFFQLIMQDKLEVCIKDWAELADEYKELELRHKEYRGVSKHRYNHDTSLNLK